MGFMEILRHKNVIYLIALYSSNTLFSTFVYGTTPLWLEASRKDGGLAMPITMVANTFLGIGIPQFFF